MTGHVVAAQLYVEQGLGAEGQFAARRALELDGENVVALGALLRVLEESGDAEAEEVRDRLTALEPDFGRKALQAVARKPADEFPSPDAPTLQIRALDRSVPAPEAVPETFEIEASPWEPTVPAGAIGLATIAPLPAAALPLSALAPEIAPVVMESSFELPTLVPDLAPAGDLISLDALAPSFGGIAEPVVEEPVMDLAALAPEPVVEEPLMDLAALAPEPVVEEPMMDLAALAPDPVVEEPVMDLAALAPDPVVEEPVMDLAALAPDPAVEELVMDLAALAPDPVVEEPVMDLAALAPDPAVEEPVMDLAALAPDPVVEEPVMDLAALAPEAEPVVDLGTLAPDEEVVSLDSLAPSLTDTEEARAPQAVEPARAAEEAVDVTLLSPDRSDEIVIDLDALRPEGSVAEPTPAAAAATVVAPPSSAEPRAEASDPAPEAPEPGAVAESVAVPEDEGEPVYTRTLAELYASQGAVKEAVGVLRRILADNPADEEVSRRVAELEAGGIQVPIEEEEEVETLARDLAESGATRHDVESPFAWADKGPEATAEVAGPTIREYFDGLLRWEPREES
ncbi:MAG: hypothetical protein EXR91_06945 [Gemmatimonadetes bacterium]|nr:hypothetical protein [Gemmatimonadota bacterium]